MLRSTQQQAAFSNTVELRNCQLLLVVSPHAQHLDDFLRIEDLIDEPMLDIDSARVCPGEISDELLVRRRILERVGSKDAWQMLRLSFRPAEARFLASFWACLVKTTCQLTTQGPWRKTPRARSCPT